MSFQSKVAKSTGEKVYDVEVNEARVLHSLQKGQQLELALDSRRFLQTIQRKEQLSFGYIGITGHPVQGNSYSNLMLKGGRLTGVLHFDGKPYRLSSSEGEYEFSRITEETHQCSLDEFLAHNNSYQKSGTEPGGTYANPSYNLDDYSDTTTVDVLILYTTNAKNWAANSSSVTDINEIFALNEGFKNDIIANSGLALNIRFTGYVEIDNPTVTSTNLKLENMRDNTYEGSSHTSDTVDIHSLREQFGADLVALVDSITDTGGLGYRMNSVGGNANGGYSVSRVQQMYFNYVLLHEIGHNFGNAHGRTQESSPAGNSGGMFHFSTGYLMTTPADSFVTVMHYTNLEGSNEGTSIPYFSNPRVNYDPSGVNLPTGAYDVEGGPSDNVLSMSITKNWLADYRKTVIDPAAISLTTTAIEDTVYPSGVSTRDIIIENTGDSDLEIKLDGEMSYSSALKMAKTNDIKQSLNLSYDFEESEGFETGTYSGYNNWISLNDSEPFEITSEQAASGSQSLKVIANSSSWVYIQSPYFSTTSRYSSYNIAMKVYSEGGPVDAYVDFSSSINEENAASFQLDNDGSVDFYGMISGSKSYWSYGSDQQRSDEWIDVSIDINKENGGTISYDYGNVSRSFTGNGFYFPENFEIELTNSSLNDLYVDDIQITAEDLYGPALTISDNRMTIRPGEQDTMTVTFYGNGYDEGVYDGNIYLETNVPTADSLITIPVDLRIDPNNLNSDGNFAVELTGAEGFRLLTAPTTINLKYFLDPLHTQGTNNADILGGSPNVWTWDHTFTGSSNAGWKSVANLDTTITAGSSFLMYVFDEDVVGDSTSRGFPKLLTTEGATISTSSPDINQNADGFTLVGNPYPATVDWNEVLQNTGTEELSGSVYAYDPTTGWKTYNASSNSGDLTNGLIKPFQGFFVQSSETVSSGPSIAFETNDVTTGGAFYGKETQNSAYARFEITDTDRDLSNSTYVVFEEKASPQKDHFDALQLSPLSTRYVTLASKSEDGYDLDINTLPNIESTLHIPLKIQASDAENVSFQLTDVSGLNDVAISLTNGIWTKRMKANQSIALDIAPDQMAENQKLSLSKKTITEQPFSLIFEKQKTTSLEEDDLPEEFSLSQNYPNPFNPSTSIRFGIPAASHVKLSVYNVLGQLVNTLVNEPKQAGFHTVSFDAQDLSSGVYLYRLEAGGVVHTQKMILMK